MRRSSWTMIAVCGLVLSGGAAVASADGGEGDQPFSRSYGVRDHRPNQVRVIRRAERHPEAAVSRSMAAQPVHPWKAEVKLNDITTYVDPMHDLHKDRRGLDADHSLRRAQRLHQRLSGVTSSQLSELRNASRAAVDRPIPANRVRVIRRERRQAEGQVLRVYVIPKQQLQPEQEQQPQPAAEPRKPRKPASPDNGQIALED